MRSLISEFSYGFALTHELVLSLGSLTAAPIFPSLIEEGREGGGYDVNLSVPGVPIFIQFKRSECLQRRSGKEIKAGASLGIPYYRMTITGKSDSDQHEMLVELDQDPNIVFYAAPMFHQKAEFDDAFLSGSVRQRSFFVRPQAIGSFSDDKAHSVSFDGNVCVAMSEPKSIEGLGIFEIESLLKARLSEDHRPLRTVVEEAVRSASGARERLLQRELDRARRSESAGLVKEEIKVELLQITAAESFRYRQEANVPAIPSLFEPSDPDTRELQQLADIGLRDFNAQLYVVQEP